jgi:hypothetical protein
MGSSGASEDATPAVEEERVMRILALGDAVGGGLGAGLSRMGEADGRYEVVIRFNEESGLARPEVYDWAAALPKILSSSDFDAVVVLIGINDRQMIREGNLRHAFGSPEWLKSYARQLDRVLDALNAAKAKVYWVSIPPVRDPAYEADMRVITDLQRKHAEAKGAVFVDIRPAFLGSDGRYVESGPDDTGQIHRLRGRDGISFFKAGNNRLGQLVLQAIEAQAPAVAAVQPTPPPDVQQPPVQAARPTVEAPIFGQAAFSGEALTIRPENVNSGAVLVLAGDKAAASPQDVLVMLRGIAQPGSAAEALFTHGDAGKVPPGRADDFTLPAPEK